MSALSRRPRAIEDRCRKWAHKAGWWVVTRVGGWVTLRCQTCSREIERRPQQVRLMAPCPCAAVGTGRCVDLDTPYDQDPAAQQFVADHPDGATLEAIAEVCGVSREAIRLIEASALRNASLPWLADGIKPEDFCKWLYDAIRAADWASWSGRASKSRS